MLDITILVAFVAGLVSFLSPCVLPIIPGFLAYLAGVSTSEEERRRFDIFLASVFFVLGFSFVFAILGVLLNTIFSHVAHEVTAWLARVGGAIIIVFGLYLTRLIRIPFLDCEYTFKVVPHFHSRHITSFLFGAAFAAGWTPCVGAVLGSILALAAATPGTAFSLLFSYALGLGIPFLLVGFFTTQADAFIRSYGRWVEYVNITFGVLLIGIGILAFTQNLGLVANFELLNRFLLK